MEGSFGSMVEVVKDIMQWWRGLRIVLKFLMSVRSF